MRKLPDKFLTAMIAVRALPGSPMYDGDDERIIRQAISDLEHYKSAGADSVFLENDHDLPYVQPPIEDEAITLMTVVSREIRKRFDGPIGIQMLEAANESSLQIATETGLDYLRVEGFVFAHVGGAGIIEGCAGRLLRLRKKLGSDHIKVFVDVKKKHCSHALTADLDITDVIRQSEFFMADGVVVTSQFTGTAPAIEDLEKARGVTELPVIIGSGMTAENIKDFFPFADGFIVGSAFRNGGRFLGELDPQRLREFMDVFNKLREGARVARAY